MSKKIEILTLFLLIVFSIYCSLIKGISFDETFEMNMGKERLRYLFSLGSYTYYDYADQRYYPGLYNTLSIFVTKMFPIKYEIHIWHLNNLIFSLFTIVGIYKITSKLFNKKVGKIVFLLCLLNPSFFGHMSINSKDLIIAFANVWSTYLLLQYLENQHINERRNRYLILTGLAVGLGTGVRIVFIGSLIPLAILVVLEILFFKKIINSQFSIKKFILDILIVSVIAYFLMIIFWPNVHSNIFLAPFQLFLESTAREFGLPWILFNGNYYATDGVPKSYLLVNLLYKLPEFILLTYIIFVFLFIFKKKYFKSYFPLEKVKIFSILFIVIFPNLFLFIIPYKIYDGLRLFLYLIPYFNIIPALVIYYLIADFNLKTSKFFLAVLLPLTIYYLFIFVSLTPYQYSYLNFFNGDFSKASKKFENDYWGLSIKELINKIPENENLISKDRIKIAFCGVSRLQAKIYLNKLANFKYTEADYYSEDFDYVIMTNRSQGKKHHDEDDKLENVKTCFENFKGVDVLSVKRKGLVLSVLRKKF